MHELTCYRDYVANEPLAFWRSMSGYEVDFILGDHTAVDAKARRNVSQADLRSLRALAEEKFKRHICVSLEPRARKEGNIAVIPFRTFSDRSGAASTDDCEHFALTDYHRPGINGWISRWVEKEQSESYDGCDYLCFRKMLRKETSP